MSAIIAHRIYLASKKIFDDVGAWWSDDDQELEEELAIAHAELGEAEFESALEAGQSMTMEETIEFVFGDALK